MTKQIPCDGCNMIAFDLGFTYEDLEEAHAIVNGKMVRHFTDCPFGPAAYPRVTQKQWESMTSVPSDVPVATTTETISIWQWIGKLFGFG